MPYPTNDVSGVVNEQLYISPIFTIFFTLEYRSFFPFFTSLTIRVNSENCPLFTIGNTKKTNFTWEQRQLGNLISKGGSGGTPTSTNSEYYNGSIPFLSITDITNSNGFIFNTEKHISEDGLNNSAAWLVPKEAISLAMYASVGKVAILKENVATSQAFYNLVIDNLDTRDFVFQFLKKMDLNKGWDSLISTGTQANLNAEKVKNLIVSIPKNIKEQSRLGLLFNNIDSLITLHQRKYIHLI